MASRRLAMSTTTAALALILSTALSGCSASAPEAPVTTGPSATASGPCVTDPQAVISRQLPAAAMGAMPSGVAEQLEKAARIGMGQASASGAVMAVRTPEGTWIKAAGSADQGGTIPMTADMHSRIGSVTKTFTGTLVLQLVQDEKVKLTDPIGRYFPEIPEGDKVTVAMLMNMTSGIASYTLDQSFQDEFFTNTTRVWKPRELMDMGIKLPRLFDPGAKFDYSNTNTVILGLLVEKLTGQSYGTVLKDRIITPLGLHDTTLPETSGTLPSPHPDGVTLQGLPEGQTAPQDATSWNPSWGWSAGALVSTVSDQLVYGRALGTGQGLLKPETQTERLTSIPGPAGYGLAAGCIGGWFGHTGEVPGFNAATFYDTRTDTTVAVMVNSDILSGDCTQSPTLPDSPKGIPCLDPATRIFVALSQALGHEFTPNPKS
ncbi:MULTISPECIES: serine hydrolase domain-containing protein [Arthrobacter]|uniref:Serine hydrolase domain-containing protein n=2 Tax=Arthrobacter TaxID=1663 RepID=A0ABU9KHS1_9MICC|nr:serine hydrolase domain-containing protein [Arthrobacter sp. YJM1]MDP5225752.1 serine hydrolase domain-containing protein [Arthrobacter sp. YJM1]